MLVQFLTRTLSFCLLVSLSLAAMAAEINVYSYRQPQLIKPMFDVFTKQSGITVNQSDIKSVVRGELKRLRRDVKTASSAGNTISRYHLQDVVDRIDNILDPK